MFISYIFKVWHFQPMILHPTGFRYFSPKHKYKVPHIEALMQSTSIESISFNRQWIETCIVVSIKVAVTGDTT